MKEKHQFFVKAENYRLADIQRQKDKKEADNAQFWSELEQSEDPFDNLEAFAEHLHRNIGSTGVYIGQLEPRNLEIEDDADEEGHLDTARPEVIKFKFANEDHRSLIKDTIIENDTGICHGVFAEGFTTQN